MKKSLLIQCLIILLFSCSSESSNDPGEVTNQEEPTQPEEGSTFEDNGVMRGLSSFEIVSDMGAGWNLGNSLDAEGENETVWGNPKTTQEMIDAVAQRGFKTLRLPVTWRFHQGSSPDYSVETEWLDRVEEVCKYGRSNGMYVIINVHHDDPWIIPTYENADEVKDRLSKLWTQIADRFKDYGDYVIFETLNEPRHENTPEEWIGGTPEGRDVVNQYHQVSLDAIRATGRNNTTRHIMISPYAASTVDEAMDDLIIPNNDERTIISIHTYFPFPFTLGGLDATWGTDEDKQQLDAELDRVVTKFVDNGRAVVLGEWSSGNQNNTSDRLAHAEYYANAAAARGLTTIWWDNGDFSQAGNGGLGVFDRRNLSWPFGNIADAVINAAN